MNYNHKTLPHMGIDEVSQLSDKELRRVYKQYRNFADRRVRQLKEHGFGDAEQVLKYRMTRLTLDNADYNLRKALMDASKFIDNKMSLLSGQVEYYEHMKKTLSDRGITVVNTVDDLRQFGEFMDEVREWVDILGVRIGTDDMTEEYNNILDEHSDYFRKKSMEKIVTGIFRRKFPSEWRKYLRKKRKNKKGV